MVYEPPGLKPSLLSHPLAIEALPRSRLYFFLFPPFSAFFHFLLYTYIPPSFLAFFLKLIPFSSLALALFYPPRYSFDYATADSSSREVVQSNKRVWKQREKWKEDAGGSEKGKQESEAIFEITRSMRSRVQRPALS